MPKIFYIGAHLQSRPLTTVVEFFSKPSAVCTKWCAQPFPLIFGLFAIFDLNFAKIVAPPSDECENYVARLKEQSLPEKKIETTSKSTYKRQRNACSNYAPLEHTALRTRSVTNKKTNKTRNKSIVPRRTMHTGRMSGHSTKKGVNYYVNNYNA